jgi:hypothetical protein
MTDDFVTTSATALNELKATLPLLLAAIRDLRKRAPLTDKMHPTAHYTDSAQLAQWRKERE